MSPVSAVPYLLNDPRLRGLSRRLLTSAGIELGRSISQTCNFALEYYLKEDGGRAAAQRQRAGIGKRRIVE